jgi:hypothetical protein
MRGWMQSENCDSLRKTIRANRTVLRSITYGISRAISSTVFLLLLVLFFTQPNVFRAFTPELFGIKQVTPNIYTDQRLKAEEIKRAIAVAEKNATAFFQIRRQTLNI